MHETDEELMQEEICDINALEKGSKDENTSCDM